MFSEQIIVASLLGTFVGNPITFPIITVFNLKLEGWILGSSEYSSDDEWQDI